MKTPREYFEYKMFQILPIHRKDVRSSISNRLHVYGHSKDRECEFYFSHDMTFKKIVETFKITGCDCFTIVVDHKQISYNDIKTFEAEYKRAVDKEVKNHIENMEKLLKENIKRKQTMCVFG